MHKNVVQRGFITDFVRRGIMMFRTATISINRKLICSYYENTDKSYNLYINFELKHLPQRDGPSVLTTPSSSFFFSMSPSFHSPSLACQPPKCQVTHYMEAYTAEPAANVHRG